MNTLYRILSSILSVSLAFMFSFCTTGDGSDLMSKAEQSLKEGNTSEAATHFANIAEYYPASPLAPKALFNLGTLQLNELKQPEKAVLSLMKLHDMYSSSGYAHKALFLAAFTQANELRNLEKAKELYGLYVREYPDSSMAESARFELANLGKSADDILKSLQDTAASQHASK